MDKFLNKARRVIRKVYGFIATAMDLMISIVKNVVLCGGALAVANILMASSPALATIAVVIAMVIALNTLRALIMMPYTHSFSRMAHTLANSINETISTSLGMEG